MSDLLERLLKQRGLTDVALVERFLRPEYEAHTHDPFLLKDMERAVSRIIRAITEGERIAIYSDFDADGIPGAVVMSDFFKKAGYENVTVMIPHRNTEGFGLNAAAIEQLAKDGVGLLVTVDCGMGDAEHIAQAQALGIEVIVTDHHLENGTPPDAYAVINPNQAGDEYPFKGLCGAAVAFKCVQALIARGTFAIPDGWEKWLLDMVGIATLSDMVPLVDENRVLATYGLMVLRKSRRVGLRALLRKVRLTQSTLTEDDIVFMVTPRINAASRMDEPEAAFRLLATDDVSEAETLVSHLHTLNNQRKGAVASMVKEIKRRLAALEELSSVVVLGNLDWQPGLLGLAASATVDAFSRPVFLWGKGQAAIVKGSARSDGSVNIVALMEKSKGAFAEFGGHERSGGFSLSHDQIHTLPETLNSAYSDVADAVSENAREDAVDAELSLEAVTDTLYGDIAPLSPFGVGNAKPLFRFADVRVEGVRRFGAEGQHLELSLRRERGQSIPAVQFFVSEESSLSRLQSGQRTTLLANIERSTFGRRPHLRLRIVDVV